MSKKVKIFAIVVGIIAVAILAFSYLGNSAPIEDTSGISSSAGSTTGASVDGITPASSNTFFELLSTIDSISLDTSVFSNPGYKALRDFPVSLGTAIIGRNNPFAPIGSDSGGGTTTVAAVQVQTLSPSKITSTSAEVGALVTASGTTPTTVVFQYGVNDTFGQSTAPVKVTNGTALFSLTNLTPATTYYVEAVAVQGSSTATGTIMTFTTAAQQRR